MILLAHSYFLRHDARQSERQKPYPPLATLLAAAVLRDGGHEVALFDAMLSDGTEEFGASLAATKPTLVAFVEDSFNYVTKMCTLRLREASVEMIAAARGTGSRVVVSSSDATDHPERYLAAGADAVIVGDVEATLAEIAAMPRPASGTWPELEKVAGLSLRGSTGAIMRTASRPATRDLDALPLPAWDFVDADAYRRFWMRAHGRFSWNIVTSRGCPFGCNWCAKPVFGRRYSQRTAASVASELRALKDAIAPDHVWFADDIFGLTPRWCAEFAREVEARDARIPFMIQCRADLLSDEVAASLAAGGCEEVWIGVESGSQRILDAMDKGTSVSEIRSATRALKAHGIRACWFLQLGYPSEEWRDVVATRDLVREEQPQEIGVSVAYPLPGTRFHANVAAQLGARANWNETGDLAMLFHGTFDSAFYRQLRDTLHDELRVRRPLDDRWSALEASAPLHRSAAFSSGH